MLSVKLICAGKIKERYFADAFSEYEKRIAPYYRFEVKEIPEQRLGARPTPAGIDGALKKEADMILAAVPKGAFLTAMCLEGERLSSEDLAALISGRTADGGALCFVIGGSFGLHECVKRAAVLRLSLSGLTFPHHLARVVLIEQLYRAAMINSGGKYHK